MCCAFTVCVLMDSVSQPVPTRDDVLLCTLKSKRLLTLK